ncbi:hypothetical protein [Pseudacidovorax intermedius]|uniref:hypothetical protein n=1 Tax=Pseudacidovorax intermedius TaxID=433924 RepID=UPI00034C25CA|nr:hypothetical protein [Pseudacidovorax intermedius]
MARWHRTEFDLLPEQAFKPRAGGGMTLEGGGGGGSSAADYAQMMATIKQTELSQEQLAWAKSVYADEAPARAEATRQAAEVADTQLAQMRQQIAITQQAQDDYTSLYRPLEQSLVTDAANYDTPERRAAESAQAVAGVEQQLAAQRGATTREMERSGVDPSSGKMAALQGSMDLNAAKLKAGAGNAAAKSVENIGYARKMDAASLGRNIASSQGTTAALASQLGTSAIGSNAASIAASQSGNGLMQGAYNTAVSGAGNAANSYGTMAGRASASNAAASAEKNTQIAAGVGAAATIAAAVI